MSDPKVETLKKEITDNIVNKFNLQIDEVLSMCESEIEKLMLLHLYRYFQKFRKNGDWINEYCEIKFLEDEIFPCDSDVSPSENLKLKERVERYNYRKLEYKGFGGVEYLFHKNVGFVVKDAWISIPGGDVIREFEIRPQYTVTIDSVDYRIDIAIILYRKTFDDNRVIESRKVALECDGYDYHSSPEQKRNDDIRTRKLKKSGWKEVLRYSGKELHSLKSIREVHSLFEEIVEILLI